MGLGETIGFANQVSQNGLNRNYQAGVWRDLLGDPTLRMHTVKPVTNVAASGIPGDTTVTWSASPISSSSEFVGYKVYRATTFNGQFSLVGTTADLSLPEVDGDPTDIYMVRALVLESTPSGSYYNASQGAFSQSL
jgi:hypothetical protein